MYGIQWFYVVVDRQGAISYTPILSEMLLTSVQEIRLYNQVRQTYQPKKLGSEETLKHQIMNKGITQTQSNSVFMLKKKNS